MEFREIWQKFDKYVHSQVLLCINPLVTTQPSPKYPKMSQWFLNLLPNQAWAASSVWQKIQEPLTQGAKNGKS